MATIADLKELATPGTPLFLADCTLSSGDVFHWSTHQVTFNSVVYSPRILQHNLFELKSSSNEATDGISKISLILGNADSFLSPIERNIGWKGAQITITFLFYDIVNAAALSDTRVVFRGVANPPDQSTESYLKLSFTNRLSLTRVYLPETRIQMRCPWSFPSTAVQLTEAIDGGAKGPFSPFYHCGYSAGLTNGVGNLNSGVPFTSCDYSRTQCQDRGMFDTDSAGNVTRRFGGIEFVPSSILVRSYGEKGSHLSVTLNNEARYNDFVPLIYGTGWYLPPIVFARNDGNLTHMEVLLGEGPITAVVKVIVNSVEIPEGIAGANMTATGWYNVFTLGSRKGAFNPDFVDSSGNPIGDPYGSMACMSVVVPNIISDGLSLPQIEVLVQGVQAAQYDSSGNDLGESFSNNPAWVMLDVLLRSGWTEADVNLPSFANAAAICNQTVQAVDLNGNPVVIPRFQCNLQLLTRRSAADVVRGIRTTANLFLVFDAAGLLQVNVEDTIANQQPTPPYGSNSTEELNGGWPVYEFGDNSFSGIVRKSNGQSSLTTSSKSTADTPNLYTVEFQDEFNEYQQDSLTLVDIDDSLLTNQQITASLTALGIPNFDQATRVASLQLNRSVHGNTYVSFETSVRGVTLRPGDIITITYSKEGFDRQPFRVTQIAPGPNYRTATVTAQFHDDAWYTASGQSGSGNGRQAGSGLGLPRPLLGTTVDASGNSEFGVVETAVEGTDGSVTVSLSVSFVNPKATVSSNRGVPLIGLNAQVATTGGSIAGGQNLYYAVTELDASGAESALSFVVKAAIPAGTNTNKVTLESLSFWSSASGFNVYRGVTPSQLLAIATNVAVANQFTDAGATAQQIGPPDVNYDHANFYWRMELQPEETVDIHSSVTVGNSTLQMFVNDFAGATVRILTGTGAGQERAILGNTATTLTVASGWDLEPDSTSTFVIGESSWQFGAACTASPATFNAPNQSGATIHISGRSANVNNQECSYALCPLTRYQIQGDGGALLDTDVPPAPTFVISTVGQGTIEVQGISFGSFDDTLSITAGTFTAGYWDELQTPSSFSLASDLDAANTMLTLNTAATAHAGDLVQIDSEIFVVAQDAAGVAAVQVTRAGYGTAAVAHLTSTPVYFLERKTFVLPFAKQFFGSEASGNYAFPAFLPDVRLATAELFMTNSRGNGPVTRRAYTGFTDSGLRTLSGGQITIQVEGPVAIQTNAAPPLTVDAAQSVRDVRAVLGTPATASDIQLQVTQNGNTYCSLVIPAGTTSSATLDGFSLGPLQAGALLGLDIISVTQSNTAPAGSDLTVTIRL